MSFLKLIFSGRSALMSLFISAFVGNVGCVRKSVIASMKLSSGDVAKVYLIKDSDPASLGLEIAQSKAASRFYEVASSPYVHFGELKIEVVNAGNGKQIAISGTSTNVSQFYGIYDDASGCFYNDSGKAAGYFEKWTLGTVEVYNREAPPATSEPRITVFRGEVPE